MASYDLVIRGGSVVDGTGGPVFTGDVAVVGQKIVAVGQVSESGRVEIDADGAVVAPGFVDVHTHYDGQATWDSRLQPSSWHGVTTVVAGNCGVGFAPVRPRDRDRLIRLMEGVEDIPGVALHEGLDWSWESFAEYLDKLDSRCFDLDIATQVPHAALRVYVMGERAVAREIATEDDVARMAQLTEEAIAAGALGFTTSRTLNHKSSTGELTPAYGAGVEELVGISSALRKAGTGVLQLVSDSFLEPESEAVFRAEIELVRKMVKASGRPLTFTLMQYNGVPEFYRSILQELKELNSQGYSVRAQVAPRGVGMILGLECTLHPFMTNPVWRSIAHLPVHEQAQAMSGSQFRAALLDAESDEKDTSVLGGLHIDLWHLMYELTDPPNYHPDPESSIAAVSARTGRSELEVALDIMLADSGRGMIYMPVLNYANGSLDDTRTMLIDDFTLPGLSDGGAHAATVCDASFATTLLQYWVRDRDHGALDLPFVVARQTRCTALAVGLNDRGMIAPGLKADLNVIDMESLRLHKPQMRYDLPAGGRRLVQRADGYRHTFVSGVETYRDGEETEALPGRLVRGSTRL